MREKIYERDLGICALCKIDTRYTKIEIENMSRDVRNGKNDMGLDGLLASLRITKKESVKSLWHADHIIPVKDGGGLCGLDNIRTLCISCHKAVTKSSRTRKT
jgi:5-methylcytosine-specific restriction endonuclease McrA